VPAGQWHTYVESVIVPSSDARLFWCHAKPQRGLVLAGDWLKTANTRGGGGGNGGH
jgi:hypothetical protein